MTATTSLPAAVPSIQAPVEPLPSASWQRTPQLILGPFYPVARAAARAAEMAAEMAKEMVSASSAKLAGERGGTLDGPQTDRPAPPSGPQALHISGRVLSRTGQPVVQALVELWHADELGRYAHTSAPLPEPLDRSFVGYAAVRSAADGHYAFCSRTPGAYTEAGQRRAPHLHVQVTGLHDRLVTQVFFPGDATNGHDRWFQTVTRRHQLVATLVHETPALLQLHWDIVLFTG